MSVGPFYSREQFEQESAKEREALQTSPEPTKLTINKSELAYQLAHSGIPKETAMILAARIEALEALVQALQDRKRPVHWHNAETR